MDPDALLLASGICLPACLVSVQDMPHPTANQMTASRSCSCRGLKYRGLAIVWSRLAVHRRGRGCRERAYCVARRSSTVGPHRTIECFTRSTMQLHRPCRPANVREFAANAPHRSASHNRSGRDARPTVLRKPLSSALGRQAMRDSPSLSPCSQHQKKQAYPVHRTCF